METYLRLPGLEKWQHYKRRNPPWIKLYNSIFNDYKFSRMGDSEKFHLIALWSLASVMDNQIPYDEDWLAARIGARSAIDLDGMIELGFVEVITEGGSQNDIAKRQRLGAGR